MVNNRIGGSATVAALVLAVAACDATGPDIPNGACAQTYEFGNHGCARFLVFIEGPAEPLPTRHRWDVRAQPAPPGIGDLALGSTPEDGQVLLEITLFTGLPAAFGDTASYWIVGKVLEDPWPPEVGLPFPVFAADSVLRPVRFARVGEVPTLDTVRLTLQRP